MNASLFVGSLATAVATLTFLWKWAHRRATQRRMSRGLRAYAAAAQLG